MWIALVAAVPPTIAALAAWRGAAVAVQQTNGHVAGPLARIEATLANAVEWQVEHDRRHLGERS